MGGRGADRPAQVQHRPAHEGPAGPRLHRDPPARPRDQAGWSRCLTEGMTPLAANRELYARKEGNGVTGFVAATGQSYLCPDTTKDPLYLEGAAGSRSSLTVPLIYPRHGHRHAQRREPAARRVRRPRPPVPRDLRPERRRGAEHAGAAPGREGQHGQRLGRGDQPRAGPAARRHHHRRDHRARPLRRPRRGHHRPAPPPALPGPGDPQPDPQGRLDDRAPAQAERRRPPRRGWPARGSSWSTPTRRSAGRPTTCSAARGRPSRRPATPTRRSP